MVTCDFLIIGGGIIGISVARELKRRHPDSKLILIEKENDFGLHASGRNSGVLHAGFYYTANSFKANFTRTGNQQLTKYCESKNILINKCGKLVVAKNESELLLLDELISRAKANKVPLDSISEKEAKKWTSQSLQMLTHFVYILFTNVYTYVYPFKEMFTCIHICLLNPLQKWRISTTVWHVTIQPSGMIILISIVRQLNIKEW